MNTIRIPLVSAWLRYGMVLFVTILIVFSSLVPPAALGVESTDSDGVTASYGPFGIDYGPLSWFDSTTWAHGMGYALFTATLVYAFVAPVLSDPTDHQRRLV